MINRLCADNGVNIAISITWNLFISMLTQLQTNLFMERDKFHVYGALPPDTAPCVLFSCDTLCVYTSVSTNVPSLL